MIDLSAGVFCLRHSFTLRTHSTSLGLSFTIATLAFRLRRLKNTFQYRLAANLDSRSSTSSVLNSIAAQRHSFSVASSSDFLSSSRATTLAAAAFTAVDCTPGKIYTSHIPMSDDSIITIKALAAQVQQLGDSVRDLKAKSASKEDIAAVVEKLKAAKVQLESANSAALEEKKKNADLRSATEDILLRKFFFVPSFEIYGGVAGLYDYGPPGCALMNNLQALWKRHFILHENMLEVSCPALTPEIVLKTSGHVDRFTDFMVKDQKTGDCYRADKLVEELVEKLMPIAIQGDASKTFGLAEADLKKIAAEAGSYNADQLKAVLTTMDAKAPDTGNDLTAPFAFNLMFQTMIGPTGKFIGYMRPETAQGIFVNFRRLLEYNGGRLPFAAAQIGVAYRNEIAPRAGLLRVREFPMAEIEHFVNPVDKRHAKFADVKDYQLQLLPKGNQGKDNAVLLKSCADAVAEGIIANESLAYFMARTQKFLLLVGVDARRLRFRQHLDTEMAHYAKDCWDAEIESSYGWIECVGHADRAAYDLQVHTDKSKVDLTAYEQYDTPKTVEKVVVKVDKAKVGKIYKAAGKALTDYLIALSSDAALALSQSLEEKGGATEVVVNGQTFNVDKDMLSVTKQQVKESGERFLPSVIEPSFGLGRIIYSLLEHAFASRADGRKYLKIAATVAPIKVGIFNVSGNISFGPVVEQIVRECVELGLSSKVDDSKVSIGRKYSRADELGVPYAISIDEETCDAKKGLCTIRDRDSCSQIQLKFTDAVLVVHALVNHKTTWGDLTAKYPVFTKNEEDKE